MLYEDNYLAHYGIKGQRWGLRRFQNEDGTLTEEGKERYSLAEKKISQKYEKQFDEASNACFFDQDVIRHWKSNYDSYQAKKKDLVEKYNSAYKNSKRIQEIYEKEKQLIDDYFKTKSFTELTIIDLLFHKEKAESRRNAMLGELKGLQRNLQKQRDEECYRIAYDTFKTLPKYEKIIAMGTFRPFEGEWSKVRDLNSLYRK